ncbi:MAG: hypothetical protein EOP38_18980 [Rubrivivax sp.]|nr:MAG: hypothetical protein EOP38_18980 [Rubrivivax sp.]
MAGGVGNDTYVVDSVGDAVAENAGEGADTILSTVSLSLNTAALANVEHLTIAGAATNATGNALNNILTGSASDNVLDGGAGNDTMIGGDGNDTYFVTSGDLVFEGNTATSGVDTVRTSASNYLLDNNVENLVMTSAGGQGAGGTDLANTITGNENVSIIDGFGGNDSILGNGGNDLLFGGLGDDTLDGGEGNDVLDGDHDSGLFTEQNPNGPDGRDVLRGGNGNDTLVGGLSDDLLSGGNGDDTYILDGSVATVVEVSSTGGTHDVIQSSVSYTFDGFLDSGIEELQLFGTAEIDATGDDRGNTLIGNDSANILEGLLGNDLLQGQGGNDLLSGGQGDDTLVGGAGTDQFEGGIGNDSLSGGLNADIYYAFDNFGADVISDIDSTAINPVTQENMDELHFLSASYESLWFKQVNNDLEISVVGTTNKATVQGWFASTNNRVEVIFDDVGGHALSALNVANLVSAMSGFSPQPITDTSNQQLVNARNAAWATL